MLTNNYCAGNQIVTVARIDPMMANYYRENDRIITVARDGARMARVSRRISVPIFTTAIYEAVARRRDGVLTWRRVGSLGIATAGRGVTQPMINRAKRYAAQLELPFYPPGKIYHGLQVNPATIQEALNRDVQAGVPGARELLHDYLLDQATSK